MEIVMNNGFKIPTIGLGTFQCSAEEAKVAVRAALDAGYRHIDTAALYGNEEAIGDVLKEYIGTGKVKREDVFITTKILPCDMDYNDVKPAFMDSFKKLQLDYVDLYLMHFPFGCKRDGANPIVRDEAGKLILRHFDITQTWKAMEAVVDEGKVRSIGLSNCSPEQMDRILKSCRIKPVVNQVECHPYLPQFELQEACKKRGIVMEAYAPLGTPGSITSGAHKDINHPVTLSKSPPGLLLEDPTIKDIAKAHGKSTAQVLLRYLIQRGIVVVPKSANPKRIKENLDVFDWRMNEAEMKKINSIKTRCRIYTFETFFKGHPEYTW